MLGFLEEGFVIVHLTRAIGPGCLQRGLKASQDGVAAKIHTKYWSEVLCTKACGTQERNRTERCGIVQAELFVERVDHWCRKLARE